MLALEANPAQGSDVDDIDIDLLAYLLTLTPAQRIERHEGALELVRALRKAGTQFYGFDPRLVAPLGDAER